MTTKEIDQARTLLADRADRTETAIEGDGQCLTAHWVDGGQKNFATLYDVQQFVAVRTILLCLMLFGFGSTTCRGQDYSPGYVSLDPADSVNWLPVTVAPPPEFGPLTSVWVTAGDQIHTVGSVRMTTAPYQFWIKRGLDPHPTHPTWWTSPQIWLYHSTIRYGRSSFTLLRDEAMAPSLTLTPHIELLPRKSPGGPYYRWWTVDDGTPRDVLASVRAVVVPEPSVAVMAMLAIVAASRRQRVSRAWPPGLC